MCMLCLSTLVVKIRKCRECDVCLIISHRMQHVTTHKVITQQILAGENALSEDEGT